MKIVILDGHTVVQEDLSWEELGGFGDLTYYERTPDDQVISRIGDADMVITSKCILGKNIIDNAPNIKYIGIIATGYNNVDIAYAKEKDITVTNIPSYSTDSVAQFAFSLLLETVNQVGRHNISVHNGDWEKSVDFCYCRSPQTEIAGKTLGIVGYGNIGKKVASLGNAFGMDVIVHSSHMGSSGKNTDIRFVDLGELLKTSDFVSLHCALTEENRNMIDRDSLSSMKKSAILINTSRGPLVNEDELADSLKSGEIAAAALDVLAEEPPQKRSPLMDLDNCIITPHIAWSTREARQKLIDIAVGNVRSFLAGKPVNTVI